MTIQSFSLTIADESFAHISTNFQNLCKIINIDTRAELKAQQLILDFQVHIPTELQSVISWQDFDTAMVKHSNYLWQATCLECFIGKKDADTYVEINASPNGAFSVYHFDKYRMPDSMPPRPLKLTDNSHTITNPAKIEWVNLHQTDDSVLQRTISFSVNHLPSELQQFDLISPCVILYCDNQPLFFTTQHATPADFHNKSYWQALIL